MNRQQLLDILGWIQNDPAHAGVDIMTFAGFCAGDELTDYVLGHFRRLDAAGRQRVLMRARQLREAA